MNTDNVLQSLIQEFVNRAKGARTTLEIDLNLFTDHEEIAAQTYMRLSETYRASIRRFERTYVDIITEKSRSKVFSTGGAAALQHLTFDYDGSKNPLYSFGITVRGMTPAMLVSESSHYYEEFRKRPEIESVAEFSLASVTVSMTRRTETPKYRFTVITHTDDMTNNVVDITEAWKIFHDTAHVYRREEYVDVITRFIKTLGNDLPRGIPYVPAGIFYRARDLKYDDLLQGGILNNVRIGFKTDGFRRALYVVNNTTWLLYGSVASLVLRAASYPNDTIIDGEYVPSSRYTAMARTLQLQNYKYNYVAYDVLKYNGVDVRSLSHIQRLARLENKHLKILPYLYCNIKTFHAFANAGELFTTVRKLQNQLNKTPYMTDGYIFVSDQLEYVNPQKGAHRSRVLHEQPDMVKWKETKDLTVDLRITPPLPSQLYMLHPSFDPVDLTPLGSISIGAIVEFRIEGRTLTPLRARIDKQNPNTEEEIQTLVKLHRDPITLSVLMGEDLSVMKKYHRIEQRRLFSEIIHEPRESHNLLELGAGRGATIDSWNKYDNVIAVEPNTDSLREMKRRLEKNNFIVSVWPNHSILSPHNAKSNNTKVTLVSTGAEDEETLRDAVDAVFGSDKASVVTMFFSLTFFRDENLERLLRVIDYSLREGGIFIHTTMEGASLKSIITPEPLNAIMPADDSKIALTTLYSIRSSQDARYDVEIFVNGEGLVGDESTAGTVRYQHEYFAYPAIIADRLFSGRVLRSRRLGQHIFLNSYEKTFSGLCSAGMYRGKHALVSTETPIQSLVDQHIEQPKLPRKTEVLPTRTANNAVGELHLPLVQLKRPTAPFAVTGYYRHQPLLGRDGVSSFYDAFLGTFFEDYYMRPWHYVDALRSIYGDDGHAAVYELAYTMHIGIVVLSSGGEIIDHITFADRPVVVIAITYDRIRHMPHYEIVSKAEDNARRRVYHTLFDNDDTIVDIKRPRYARSEGVLLLVPPHLLSVTVKVVSVGTLPSYVIASSEVASSLSDKLRGRNYDNASVRRLLEEFDMTASYIHYSMEDGYGRFVLALAEAIEHDTFIIAWGGARFDDAHIALIAALSSVARLSWIFTSTRELWLHGIHTTNYESGKTSSDVSKVLSKLRPQHTAADIGVLSRNKYYTSTVHALLLEAISFY